MFSSVISGIVTTNKGWIVRKAMGYVAAWLAVTAAQAQTIAVAHGLPAFDADAVQAALGAAALYVIEAVFSWLAKQVAVR